MRHVSQTASRRCGGCQPRWHRVDRHAGLGSVLRLRPGLRLSPRLRLRPALGWRLQAVLRLSPGLLRLWRALLGATLRRSAGPLLEWLGLGRRPAARLLLTHYLFVLTHFRANRCPLRSKMLWRQGNDALPR